MFSNVSQTRDITDFDAVRLSVASSERILSWSHGEVLKPETINYRTQKPERDGLFCERIFGPVRNININDPKFRGIRTRDLARNEKGEIITNSIVRRERMGHISLAAPVSHIWFLRGTPSAIGLLLNMTVKNIEKVVYFASYIITSVKSEERDQALADLESEIEAAKAAIDLRYEKESAENGSDTKQLAKQRTAELDELNNTYQSKKTILGSLEQKRLIGETEYNDMPEEYRSLISVSMGAQALKTLLDEVDMSKLVKSLHEEAEGAKGQRRKKVIKRLKVLEGMLNADISSGSMVLTVVPVIPPDLRPMVQLTGGRFATSDLNDLYRRVINRNNRLRKLIDLKAPEVIRRNEMRMLQEAVDALIDNGNARSGRAVAASGGRRRLKSLADMLKGKQGRFRQNLLGKRVDYSGRSVIVSGPDLSINECGLPKMMALELFKPFVMGSLIAKDLAHNIRSASRMIELNATEVWDSLDEVIRGKYVLLNRAPTLHRLSVQAFQPKLVEGKAIQLHPLVCKGFNADFDGDQMAVHLPLSREAQWEARSMMASAHNLLKPSDGTPVLHFEQDIVLGLYYLTYEKPNLSGNKTKAFSGIEDALMAYDRGLVSLQSSVTLDFRGDNRTSTLGRFIFNEVFPEDFPFQDAAMSKKQLKSVMSKVFATYGQENSAMIADDVKNIGFEYATRSGLSIGISDFIDIEGIDKVIDDAEIRAREISEQFENGFVTEEERYRLTVKSWLEADSTITKMLEEQFAGIDNTLSMSAVSGARGSIGQIKQATGMVGVVVDAVGREIELPIRSNYKSGFSTQEYFIATRGARKGLIDTALKTADSGYLTRKLVDVSQDVFTLEDDESFNDPGLVITKSDSIERGLDFAERISGRVLSEDVKVNGKTLAKKEQLLDIITAKDIVNGGAEQVSIYSILTTRSVRGIPQKSYGADMTTGKLVAAHQPIGVVAAQSIGEPGTQLTLDTKHSHGAAAEEDVTQGLPRVEELLEARTPKGQAYLSEIDGSVSVREEAGNYIVQVASEGAEVETIKLGKLKLAVKKGSTLSKGDVIATDGKQTLVAPFDCTIDITKGQAVLASTKGSLVRYQIPAFRSLVVKNGDEVQKGDRLTIGSLHLQELMSLKGIDATQAYIMSEIQKIFSSQGQVIADKHLEIVVRQMFSRVQIDDPGDSPFVIGDIVSRAAVVEKNQELIEGGKAPAEYTQMLLGIAKVATWSDSFLSAASFQDTTRVLIGAATSGRVDHLYGLKENVIIGRKIPVGTGAPGFKLSEHMAQEDTVENAQEVAV